MKVKISKQLKTAKTEKSTHLDYFKIALSVDCVIFGFEKKELKVLLIKCDLKEFKNKWSLLGNLVKPDEDLEKAPYRILKQRTGLDDVFLQQVESFGGLNRHPSGRVITTAYYSLINIKDHQLKSTDNEVHWHSVADIKELAFDHNKIFDSCLKKLRQQVINEPIVFNLLPKSFSLRDLQNLYESILGVKLDRRNFRKKLSQKNWLEALNEIEKNVPHRPGMLYKLKSSLIRKQSNTSLNF